MKNLLYKEFKLTGAKITYIFLSFTLMCFIPSYPILVSTFFICMGIFYTFQFAREYNDITYTTMLPVKKRDVVKARYLFVVILEIVAIILYSLFVVLQLTVLKNSEAYAVNALMHANIAFIGFSLIGFMLFNTVFLGKFFKTAYEIGKPFILFCVAIFIFIGIGETLHHIPGLTFLNDMSGSGLLKQLIVLGIGLISYIVGTVLSYYKSAKHFDKIDL